MKAGVCLTAFCDLARLPVFALPPAESLRILMEPDASHTQNSIAAVSAEAARQRCGNATVPACFPWTIGALFDRPKREEPSEFCRVFGPWTAGAGTSFFSRMASFATTAARRPGKLSISRPHVT